MGEGDPKCYDNKNPKIRILQCQIQRRWARTSLAIKLVSVALITAVSPTVHVPDLQFTKAIEEKAETISEINWSTQRQ